MLVFIRVYRKSHICVLVFGLTAVCLIKLKTLLLMSFSKEAYNKRFQISLCVSRISFCVFCCYLTYSYLPE